MIARLKTALRNALPAQSQVPIKYWYDRFKGYAEPEMALLADLNLKGSHVADIGANRGSYAYCLRSLGATVEAFEPNPDCLSVLTRWAEGTSQVRVHPVALAADEGEATLHVPVDEEGVEHDASASINAAVASHSRQISIRTASLDSFGFDDLAFIKIDTEGHETNVLAGAAHTLERCSPALLIEIEQRHNADGPITAIFDRLRTIDYDGFFLKNGRLHPLDQFDPARDQADALFESHADAYINNFLFLNGKKAAAGDYARLFGKWMPD
jgi:FkbM family methyltransferase